MKVEKKLQEMGFEIPEVAAPAGVYVLARRVGNLLYLAGQTAHVNGEVKVKGVVGKDLTIEEGQEGARLSALNILSVLKSELGDLDRVKQFVQMIGYVRCTDDFGNYTGVVDGASILFQELYGEIGLAARMTVGTNELPGGSVTEIMTVVEVED
ncbi:MAG: RidA family protein [Dorea sp.]|jgi:enamine deaminase RidA (YjgF/YER057c/UK114 family)|nr:RidA family protein [Dorea sp.]